MSTIDVAPEIDWLKERVATLGDAMNAKMASFPPNDPEIERWYAEAERHMARIAQIHRNDPRN